MPLRILQLTVSLVAGTCTLAAQVKLGLAYDSSRLRSYTDAELIGLLSHESLARNVSISQGLVNLRATHPAATPPQLAIDSNAARRAVLIPITAATTLSYPEAVVEELARRQPVRELLQVFDTTVDIIQLSWLLETLDRMRGPLVDSALTRIATTSDTVDPREMPEHAYFALKYFAQTGTPWALRILNCNYDRWPVSSMERAEVVALFGKYKFYPAASNLVETIGAMLINLNEAALTGLAELFPDGQRDFKTLDDAGRYWKRYVARHGERARSEDCSGIGHHNPPGR